jgi:Esterase/lipase
VAKLLTRTLQRSTQRTWIPVGAQRAWTEAAARIIQVPPGISISHGSLGGVPSDRIAPEGGDDSRAVLYLHGGAYVLGSRRTHRGLAAQIALAAGAPVHLLDYRLGPEHRHPAALEDTVAAYRDLLASGIDAKSIVVAGDSAGGGLAVAMATRLRDEGQPLPGGLAILNGWLDLTCSGASMSFNADRDAGLLRELTVRGGELYRGETDPLDPELSPIRADLRGLPPTYLQVGTHDLLLSDSELFAERARAAGVDVGYSRFEGMWHDFQISAGLLREADEAMADLAGALDDIWAGRPLAARAGASSIGSQNGSPSPTCRDRRRGLRRHRPRNHAEEGRDRRADDFRKGGRGRRRLAGQHISGGGLRRPLAPLLVLVRAQPRLEPPLLAAVRDPRLLGAVRREVRPAAQPPARNGCDSGGVRR